MIGTFDFFVFLGHYCSMDYQPPSLLSCGNRDLWALSNDIDFLNHGSFGARPHEILNYAEDCRRKIESDIVHRLAPERDLLTGLNLSKICASKFLKCDFNQIHFVENASCGIASILRSYKWNKNSEIVLTSHVYGAVQKQVEFLSRQYGISIKYAKLPWPVYKAEDIINSVLNSITDSTTILILDAITSISGLVIPYEKIIHELKKSKVKVLIDAAHLPGQLDINLNTLKPDFLVGNFHKWACAPIGCAFLYIGDHIKDEIAPAVPSWGQDINRNEAFYWQGTRDYTPWLVLPKVFEWCSDSWESRREYNNSLAKYAHKYLVETLDVDPRVPLDGSCSAHMYSIVLPDTVIKKINNPEKLTEQLYRYARIEIPVMKIEKDWCIRISSQVYNNASQYHRLGKVLQLISEGYSIIDAGKG